MTKPVPHGRQRIAPGSTWQRRTDWLLRSAVALGPRRLPKLTGPNRKPAFQDVGKPDVLPHDKLRVSSRPSQANGPASRGVMNELEFDAGVEKMLESLLAGRLVLLAGAGLSMAPPSNLPSAWTIAQEAKRRYDRTHGMTRAPLSENVEEQAEYFFARGELDAVYFRTLIDAHAFAGNPNEGHIAIADLMFTGAIKSTVTTNVDVLIEAAGQPLFGQIEVGLDGLEVATVPSGVSPLLKIHGCRQKDSRHMVWARTQITAPPIADRIASSANWLAVNWLNRDVLIVGYWTDWDYLNAVLAQVLDQVQPTRIVVVDTAVGTDLPRKAPALHALGEKVQNGFYQVRASGADFLAALRKEFSKTFIRRVIGSGIEAFKAEKFVVPPAMLTEPPDLENHELWAMRRDLAGCPPNSPASSMEPPNETTLGLTVLKLRNAGAVPDGPYWRLNDQRIRVLRTANELLHVVKDVRARECPPATAPDVVIAVGADPDGLPANIARSSSGSSIARGADIRWLTRGEATKELGL